MKMRQRRSRGKFARGAEWQEEEEELVLSHHARSERAVGRVALPGSIKSSSQIEIVPRAFCRIDFAASARVQMTRLSFDVGTDARSAGRREYFEAIQMRARRPQRRERAGLKGLAGAAAPRELLKG